MNKVFKLGKHMFSSNKILFEQHSRNCKVTLNHEKTLNSVDIDMIRAFRQQIDQWEIQGYPHIVLLTANPNSKAFSAGGDIKDLYYQKQSGTAKTEELT